MKYWILSVLITLALLGAFALFCFLCFKSIAFALSVLSVLAIFILFRIVKHIRDSLVEQDERDKEIEIAEKRAEEIREYIATKFKSGNMTNEDIEYLKEVLWKR